MFLKWPSSYLKQTYGQEFGDQQKTLYREDKTMIKWRRMKWAGHVARMGYERGVYRVLVGKQEGRRELGRPRRRWVDNIRIDQEE